MWTGDERRRVQLGGGVVELTPLEPGVWEPLAANAPGPASLCLELLVRAGPAWRGVAGKPAPDEENLARLPAGTAKDLLAGLRAPWLEAGQEQTLEELRRYLEARADFPGLDCAACARQQQAGEGEPDCVACPLPPLPAEAREALRLAALLRSLPPGAGALLPGLLAGRPPGRLRLLLSALGLVHRRLGPPAGPSPGGMLE